MPGNVVGAFAALPQGCILHGTRSGRQQSVEAEFSGTINFVRNGAGGLGWNCTVGNHQLGIHIAVNQWGWNARAASSRYLAAEFAQPTADYTITDAQVDAFCYWWNAWVLPQWPGIPRSFPMHSELPEGVADGKSDCYPRGDPRADELRARILARL